MNDVVFKKSVQRSCVFFLNILDFLLADALLDFEERWNQTVCFFASSGAPSPARGERLARGKALPWRPALLARFAHNSIFEHMSLTHGLISAAPMKKYAMYISNHCTTLD